MYCRYLISTINVSMSEHYLQCLLFTLFSKEIVSRNNCNIFLKFNKKHIKLDFSQKKTKKKQIWSLVLFSKDLLISLFVVQIYLTTIIYELTRILYFNLVIRTYAISRPFT